jgi:hypothetical protein
MKGCIMGHTNYWHRDEKLNREKFRQAVKDIKKVREVIGTPIQREYDDSRSPVANDNLIRFNGIGEEGHETFYVSRVYSPDFKQYHEDGKRLFQFCKTAYKPYDTLVCCCLVILNHYFGDSFVVSSDGEIDSPDWKEAKKVCQECFGYGEDFQFDNDESNETIERTML